MRGRFLILFAVACGGAFSTGAAAGQPTCGRRLLMGLTEEERAKDRETLALSPLTTDEEIRRALREAAHGAGHVVKYGRGSLPSGVRLHEAQGVLPVITRLAETDDVEGMRRFLADPKTDSRLGAQLDRRVVRIHVTELVVPMEDRVIPRLGTSNVGFLEWFVDQYVDVRGNPRALFEPNGDAARRKSLVDFFLRNEAEPPPWTEKTNVVVLPDRVEIVWVDGKVFTLPNQIGELLALGTLRGAQLDRERLRLLSVLSVLADWEEMFHAIDWAVWTATGESASPAMNRLCEHLGVPYEWWAHAELAVALYGRYDSKVLAPKDPVRESFWRNYPKLRHLIGQSPRLETLLK